MGAVHIGISRLHHSHECVLPWATACCFLSPASHCNVSLKKQRHRSILSSFFCCFRDYNVEAPPASSPSVLPPLVEENGGLPKVSAAGTVHPAKQRSCRSCTSWTHVLPKSLGRYRCSHLLNDPKLPKTWSLLLKDISVVPV